MFVEAQKRAERVSLPFFSVMRRNSARSFAGILVCFATFVLFYVMTVFTLTWGTTALHYDRDTFLIFQLAGVVFFGAAIPFSAWVAEFGRRPTMIGATILIGLFGLGAGAAVQVGNGWCTGHDGRGADADGPDVWAAGNGGVSGAVSNSGTVYRMLDHVQHGGNSGGVAGAVYRDLAGDEVWPAIRGLLLDWIRCDHAAGADDDSRDAWRQAIGDLPFYAPNFPLLDAIPYS